MARRSLDERRSEYLDIGAGIIAEVFDGSGKDPALALSHVKMADVAERANVTKSALYHIWESQEAFWQDLLERLLEINSELSTEYLLDLEARDTSEVSGLPTMYDHADAVFNSLAANPALFARIGMVAYLSDEEVRRQFDEQYRSALNAYGYSMELAIEAMGRRLRDGFEMESVLVTVDALLEGLCLSNRVSEDLTPQIELPDGSHATLYSVALEAVVVGYTEPVDGGSAEAPIGVMSNIALRLFQGEALTEILEGDDEAIEFWTSHVEQASGTSEADSREADTSETATEAKPSSRPSAQDRKEDYLDIGMEILTRFTPAQAAAATSDALAHVLVSDVAERAGVTKGSVYHIWPSQEAFRRDLLTQILERENGIGIQQIAGLVEAGQNSDGDPATLLRAASNVAFDIMKNDPLFFARFSFYLFATNPEVSELLYRSDEQLAEQFGGAIDLYLNLRGRQLRKPFTIEMIVITGSSLLMGLTLRYRTSPEVVDGFRDADPSLPGRYATGLEAICMHFSEPKPDA